jgi:hypothetical protein
MPWPLATGLLCGQRPAGRFSPINGLVVINFAIRLVVTPMPVVVVAIRRLGIQVPVVPVVPVSVAVAATSSTASHWVFGSRSGTVLRYREGASTRQQYCRHREAFE